MEARETGIVKGYKSIKPFGNTRDKRTTGSRISKIKNTGCSCDEVPYSLPPTNLTSPPTSTPTAP
jgi:hypothetical protein